MTRARLVLIGLWLVAGTATPTLAQDGNAFAVGIGAFDVEDSDRSAELRLEYHPGLRMFRGSLWDGFDGFAPMIGFMTNGDGAVFGYGGVQTDVFLDERWIATPAFGIGGYGQGDSEDLGGVFEFHLGLTVAYEFTEGQRLGLTWTHISNGGLHDANPSANSLLLIYRARFDALF